MNNYSIILDCYTDEPSGYGTPPFIGTHQTLLSQALEYIKEDHYYLTIDDLRLAHRITRGQHIDSGTDTDIEVINKTKNHKNSIELLHSAKTVYVIMGCFIDYTYFSAVPPKSNEVYEYIKGTKGKKILFYVLGGERIMPPSFHGSPFAKCFDRIFTGNAYRAVLEGTNTNDDCLAPNYPLMSKISHVNAPIIAQLNYPVIAEIETGSGCNRPTCSFCIESHRKLKIIYREPEDIIRQIATFYRQGVRHFRLGRQPNIYHYKWQNTDKFEMLFNGIWQKCPDIETLHVDNVNILDVITDNGIVFTKLIAKYCTSGNIAPFGIESFDPHVRKTNNIHGSCDDILKAIEIINAYGRTYGQDGLPLFLPGINLIYGLPGQSEKTHEINMHYLSEILARGLMTRRLFFRKLTRPSGVTFDISTTRDVDNLYDLWKYDITNDYVMPMQNIVFQKNSVLRSLREVIFNKGKTYLRSLGTCSERAVVDKILKIKPYGYYNAKVIGHIGPREILCEINN